MFDQRKIDHIVYAVPDLDEAISWFESVSGVRPVFGGYHANHGTKNALVNLGEGCYLEFIAIDEENTKITPPYWMGLSLLGDKGRITRWSLKSNKLEYDSTVLKSYHPAMGFIIHGQRKTTSGKLLSWQMTLPLAEPLVALVPFMTDWQTSDFHPTDQLPEQCHLLALELNHPKPTDIQPTLDNLKLELKVNKSKKQSIRTILDTPKGEIRI
jgi:hypothetical protein